MASQSSGLMDTKNIKWDSQTSSPFRSMSRSLYPKTVSEVFDWGQEMWLHHGMYSQGIQKAVRYFMTDIEIDSGGDEVANTVRKKYRDVLEKNYHIKNELAIIGDEYIAFGNSFTSLHIPFLRHLMCPVCGFRAPLKKMYDDVKWSDYKFTGRCPNEECGRDVEYEVKDLRVPDETMKPKIIRWPPQFMRLKSHPFGRVIYYLDVTAYKDLDSGVSKGDLLYLEETPWEIIKAIKEKQPFQFDEGVIYHMCNPSVASIDPGLKGWGLPKFMAEFETVIMVMMLDKYNEMILADYLIPFRVLAPPGGGGSQNSGSGDPMLQMGMGKFSNHVREMIERHRKNPTDWNFFPFPIQYQALGGEAKNLTPVELMEHFEQRLLNSMGIPQEFYSGSIQNSAGPIIGFKMFERTWQHFAKELDKWLTWFVQKQGELLKWENVTARLVPVSIYEDPEVRGLKLDLAASGQVSKTTAFRTLDLNPEYEQQRIMEEEDEFNEKMMERQAKQQAKDTNVQAMTSMPAGQALLDQQAAAQQQAAGGAPAPAPAPGAPAPAPAPGGTGGTIDEMMADADAQAQNLITLEPSQRRSELLNLKKTNEALHALVKSRLTTLEQMASQQGLQMTRQGQLPLPGQQQ